MKKDKIVMYECTSRWCKLIVPEGHEDIQRQKRKNKILNLALYISCPECGAPTQRKVMKE